MSAAGDDLEAAKQSLLDPDDGSPPPALDVTAATAAGFPEHPPFEGMMSGSDGLDAMVSKIGGHDAVPAETLAKLGAMQKKFAPGGLSSVKDFKKAFAKLPPEDQAEMAGTITEVYDAIPPEERESLIKEHLPPKMQGTVGTLTKQLDSMAPGSRAQMLQIIADNMDDKGSIDMAHASKAIAKLVSKDSASNLKEWIAHGPTSVRVLGFLGGLACIVAGVSGIFIDLIMLTQDRVCMRNGRAFVRILVNAYLIIFGIFLVMLEARTLPFLDGVRRWIVFEFHAVNRSEGRGVLYLFVGSLALSAWSVEEILSVVAGAYCMVIGLMNLILGWRFHSHLKESMKMSEEETEKFWKLAAGKGAKPPFFLDDQQFVDFLSLVDPTMPRMKAREFKDFSSEFRAKYDNKISLDEYLQYRADFKKDDIRQYVLGSESKKAQ